MSGELLHHTQADQHHRILHLFKRRAGRLHAHAHHGIDVDKILTDRWRLAEPETAYVEFNKQAAGREGLSSDGSLRPE